MSANSRGRFLWWSAPCALGSIVLVVALAALSGGPSPSPAQGATPDSSSTKKSSPTDSNSGSSSTKKTKSSVYVILGVTSGPGDKWISEVNAQGAHFDMRYQYLAGGVNTAHPWKTWNQPAGQFVLDYFKDSDRMGVFPCMTYYQMYQSLPCGGKGDESQGNKQNVESASTMKDYLEDMKLLFQKAGEYGKPVVIHHEPDLWGYFSVTSAFAPNDPGKIKVMVKSSGMPEAAEFEDTAAGFGKCIVSLRDKYAPNVVLAWHASKWGNPNAQHIAAFLQKCGKWDMVFIDPSDRDSGWKMAHGQSQAAAWWTDKDFTSFRDWGGEIHRQTGLPLMAWQIPMGNTIMATCNNTEGHYMDNRAEYFLENYPTNKHIAEWAEQGFVGYLFGGGAGGCTDIRDGRKDGITNPTPITGNKGEKATVADDDGGYLRQRGTNYYAKGPVPLADASEKPDTTTRGAKKKPTTKTTTPPRGSTPSPGSSSSTAPSSTKAPSTAP